MPAVNGFDGHLRVEGFQRADAEAGVQFDGSGLDEAAQAGTELAAGGQPVGVAAAVDLLGGRAADGPEDPGVRFVLGEVGEIDQGVGGGVAGADDQDTAAGERVPVAAGDVRERAEIRSAAASSPMAGRPEVPSGLRVDHVPEASMTAATVWSRVSPSSCWTRTTKGVVSRFRVWVLSMPRAGHGDDPGAGLQPGSDRRKGGQRGQVLVDEFPAVGQGRGPG